TAADAQVMRVLVLARVYPNAARPTHGVFVRDRVRPAAEHRALRVVAPIPRFPPDGLARRAPRHKVPRVERDGAIAVHHPSVMSIPAGGKSLDGGFYLFSLLPL